MPARKPPRRLIENCQLIASLCPELPLAPRAAILRHLVNARPTAHIQRLDIGNSGQVNMAGAPSANPIYPEKRVPISWPQPPVRQKATEAFSTAARSISTVANAFVRVTGRSVRRVRRAAWENPVYLVAGVAAVSLVAGVALRVWRSQQHD